MLEDGAFVIGGQALNLWAEYFSSAEELAQYRPFTSKDIDYFGNREAAEKLAAALGGRVFIPDVDNHTPQTAIVEAEIGGDILRIDFLGSVLGVRAKALESGVAEIIFPSRKGNAAGMVAIPVMHPLHCLQSRIANLITLGRSDDTARKQAEAAPIVLREYIALQLRNSEVTEATDTLAGLFNFLSRDLLGRRAHRAVARDPLEAMMTFADDDRLDARYREKTLQPAIAKIKKQRTATGE